MDGDKVNMEPTPQGLVAEVRAAVEAATPGVWCSHDDPPDIWSGRQGEPCTEWGHSQRIASLHQVGPRVYNETDSDSEFPQADANARLIANAPTWLGQLCTALTAALDAKGEMHAAIVEWRDTRDLHLADDAFFLRSYVANQRLTDIAATPPTGVSLRAELGLLAPPTPDIASKGDGNEGELGDDRSGRPAPASTPPIPQQAGLGNTGRDPRGASWGGVSDVGQDSAGLAEPPPEWQWELQQELAEAQAGVERYKRALISLFDIGDDWAYEPMNIDWNALRQMAKAALADAATPDEPDNGLLFGAKNIAEENMRLAEWELERVRARVATPETEQAP